MTSDKNNTYPNLPGTDGATIPPVPPALDYSAEDRLMAECEHKERVTMCVDCGKTVGPAPTVETGSDAVTVRVDPAPVPGGQWAADRAALLAVTARVQELEHELADLHFYVSLSEKVSQGREVESEMRLTDSYIRANDAEKEAAEKEAAELRDQLAAACDAAERAARLAQAERELAEAKAHGQGLTNKVINQLSEITHLLKKLSKLERELAAERAERAPIMARAEAAEADAVRLRDELLTAKRELAGERVWHSQSQEYSAQLERTLAALVQAGRSYVGWLDAEYIRVDGEIDFLGWDEKMTAFMAALDAAGWKSGA